MQIKQSSLLFKFISFWGVDEPSRLDSCMFVRRFIFAVIVNVFLAIVVMGFLTSTYSFIVVLMKYGWTIASMCFDPDTIKHYPFMFTGLMLVLEKAGFVVNWFIFGIASLIGCFCVYMKLMNLYDNYRYGEFRNNSVIIQSFSSFKSKICRKIEIK